MGRQEIYIQQDSHNPPYVTVASITNTKGVNINLDNIYDSFLLSIDNCQGEEERDGVTVVASIEGNHETFFSAVSIENSNISSLYFNSLANNANDNNRTLLLTNCTFFTNSELSSNFFSTIFLNQTTFQQTTIHFLNQKMCIIFDVTFIESLLYISGASTVAIEQCEFKSGTPKFSYLMPSPFIVSNVEPFFYGESQFINNTGYRGGALNMFKSTLYLAKNAKLYFINNTANDTGGAI